MLLVVNLISEATTFEEARESGKWFNLTFICGENDQVEEVLCNMEQDIGVARQGDMVWLELDVPVLLAKGERCVCWFNVCFCFDQ